ncbi:MAG: hypothetical protein JW982_09320 [Spirochaetes bacterium]|nr:hypothetical protein [Spirochaetota bacterium]
MKINIISVIFIASFISCMHNFKDYEIQSFNQKICERTDITTPEELILMYLNYPQNEVIPEISIKVKNLGENNYKIILVSDNIRDDSVKAEKIIIIAQMLNSRWKVYKIIKSWKCWKGRGNSLFWHGDYCT